MVSIATCCRFARRPEWAFSCRALSVKSGGLDPGRLTAISDGIFDVALTLLILDVRPPDVAVSKLGAALIATAPRFGIFALSFAIVAYYWSSTI